MYHSFISVFDGRILFRIHVADWIQNHHKIQVQKYYHFSHKISSKPVCRFGGGVYLGVSLINNIFLCNANEMQCKYIVTHNVQCSTRCFVIWAICRKNAPSVGDTAAADSDALCSQSNSCNSRISLRLEWGGRQKNRGGWKFRRICLCLKPKTCIH